MIVDYEMTITHSLDIHHLTSDVCLPNNCKIIFKFLKKIINPCSPCTRKNDAKKQDDSKTTQQGKQGNGFFPKRNKACMVRLAIVEK